MVARVEPVAAQKRVALVIGTSAYVNTGKLENPKNDAADMAAKLKELGFDVVEGKDLTKAEMDRTIVSFAERLRRLDTGTTSASPAKAGGGFSERDGLADLAP
jgi:uncharacterized caspase-like protein